MSRFKPVTEKQAMESQRTLLEPGVWNFKVIDAEETTRSSTGALMFKIKIECWGPGTGKAHVYDYLGTDFMEYKLRHFCYATGIGDEYEQGEVYASDMMDRTGQVDLRFNKESEWEQYGKKNEVKDYEAKSDPMAGHEEKVDVAKEVLDELKDTPVTEPSDVDEIPF